MSGLNVTSLKLGFTGGKPKAIISYTGLKILLEGDAQTGTDKILLEGDAQTGTDVILLEGQS